MSVESAALAGRAAAELRMTSTVTIRRAGSGAPTYGPDGDQVVSQGTVYSGPCRVGAGSLRQLTVGGTQSEQATRTLHLPAGTAGLKDADVATIDSGETAGLVLRLLEVTWQDQATALRIACVEA